MCIPMSAKILQSQKIFESYKGDGEGGSFQMSAIQSVLHRFCSVKSGVITKYENSRNFAVP